jgi:hypothetical protein
MQGLLEKLKLVQDAYEECREICGKEGKVLSIEPNNIVRKHSESAHKSLVAHLISKARISFPSLKRKLASYTSIDECMILQGVAG